MEDHLVMPGTKQAAVSFRPQFTPFVLIPVAVISAIWLAVAAVVYFMANFFVSAGTFAALSALTYFVFVTRFQKERYMLHSDRFVYHGGGVASDVERELIVKNVTHVTVKEPFLEALLFKTGSIYIQSAGASDTEITLRSVERPREVYEQILGTMKQSAFKLTCSNLVQQERPHPLAVFFEVFGIFSGVLIFTVLGIAEYIEENSVEALEMGVKHPWVMLGGVGAFLILLLICAMVYMDLRQRIYRLYEDTIEHTGGIFTKIRSIIPMENLSDSDVTQSFISRIFDLYDVKLSCQGSGQEIVFKNIENGKKLSGNIDELISKKRQQNIPLVEGGGDEPRVQANAMGQAQVYQSKVVYDTAYTSEFRMSKKKLLPFGIGLLALLAMPFLWGFPEAEIILILVAVVSALGAFGMMINIQANNYRIKEDGVAHDFRFLSTRNKEFSLEKITGIIIIRGIWDRLLNLTNIKFWSIGSGESIIFNSVKLTPEDKQKILGKKGVQPQGILYSLESKFSIVEMIKANYIAAIFLIVVVAGLIASGFPVIVLISLLVLAGLLFFVKHMYYKQSKIVFYRDYIHFHHGLLKLQDVYVLYDDVKDITTIRYPGSSHGSVQFNVAGETLNPLYQAQARRNLGGKLPASAMISNQFTIHYVDQIPVLDELVDTIFDRRPGPQEVELMMCNPVDTSLSAVHVSKPALINTVAAHLLWLIPANVIIISVGMFLGEMVASIAILAGIDLLILGSCVANLLVVSYSIQDYRVLARSGILTKKQTSVTFNKIDFININRGLGNKIFGNGNITVNTVGSSKAELILKNIPDYRRFYDLLKQKYQ